MNSLFLLLFLLLTTTTVPVYDTQIKKEHGTTRIDYHHFLHGYNPHNAPHALEGPTTLRLYDNKPPLSTGLSVPLTNNQKSDLAGTLIAVL